MTQLDTLVVALLPTLLMRTIQMQLPTQASTLRNKSVQDLVSNATDSCVASPASVGEKALVFFSFGGALAEKQQNGAGIIFWMLLKLDFFVSAGFYCI